MCTTTAILHTIALLKQWMPGDTRGGTYHLSAEGVTSWHGFASAIFAAAGRTDITVEPIPTEAYPTPAERPIFSVLDKGKFRRDFGVVAPDWREGLQTCVQKRDE